MRRSQRRLLHGLVLAGLALALHGASVVKAACQTMWITGYVHTGNLTASGRPTYGNEWAIAAAPAWLPFGTVLEVEGIGALVVADRGMLGNAHIDVLVSSRAEAFALTSYRQVCW